MTAQLQACSDSWQLPRLLDFSPNYGRDSMVPLPPKHFPRVDGLRGESKCDVPSGNKVAYEMGCGYRQDYFSITQPASTALAVWAAWTREHFRGHLDTFNIVPLDVAGEDPAAGPRPPSPPHGGGLATTLDAPLLATGGQRRTELYHPPASVSAAECLASARMPAVGSTTPAPQFAPPVGPPSSQFAPSAGLPPAPRAPPPLMGPGAAGRGVFASQPPAHPPGWWTGAGPRHAGLSHSLGGGAAQGGGAGAGAESTQGLHVVARGHGLRVESSNRSRQPLRLKDGLPVTSLTINSLPIDLHQQQLRDLLDEAGFAFDYLYLPRNFKNGTNQGHAFVNFVAPEEANRFFVAWHGATLLGMPSGISVITISVSSIQGLDANVKPWTPAKLRRIKTPEYRPFIATEVFRK